MGLRRQRAVQADDVCRGKQLREPPGTSGERHSGAQRLDEPSRLATDPAWPDDADELAVEALAEHELEREAPRLAPPEQAVALGDATEQREHQRQRELGRRTRQHVRRVRDEDVVRAGSVEVEVVHADRVVGNDPQPGTSPVEQRRVHGRGQEREDPVDPLRSSDQLEVLGEGRGDRGGDLPGDVDSHDAGFSTQCPLVRRP